MSDLDFELTHYDYEYIVSFARTLYIIVLQSSDKGWIS